jgi:putative acetyltransferase
MHAEDSIPSIVVRPEQPEDHAAVRSVNELAFGRPAEADLVDALRVQADRCLSLVAEVDGEIVGHFFLSPVEIISPEATVDATGLGPMAVRPDHQNRGIGSALVRAGLAAVAERGETIAVVLGHPEFYPRFGFVPGASKGIGCEYPVPDEVFMVAELTDGALDGRKGVARYHRAFADV